MAVELLTEIPNSAALHDDGEHLVGVALMTFAPLTSAWPATFFGELLKYELGAEGLMSRNAAAFGADMYVCFAAVVDDRSRALRAIRMAMDRLGYGPYAIAHWEPNRGWVTDIPNEWTAFAPFMEPENLQAFLKVSTEEHSNAMAILDEANKISEREKKEGNDGNS